MPQVKPLFATLPWSADALPVLVRAADDDGRLWLDDLVGDTIELPFTDLAAGESEQHPPH